MIRVISIAALFLAMSNGVEAATTAMHDLSHVTCTDAYTIKFIRETIAGMRYSNGASVMSFMGDNSALTAKLIYARKDSFACRVSVNFQFGKGTQGVVGKFTYREFPGGEHNAEFMPGY